MLLHRFASLGLSYGYVPIRPHRCSALHRFSRLLRVSGVFPILEETGYVVGILRHKKTISFQFFPNTADFSVDVLMKFKLITISLEQHQIDDHGHRRIR